MVRRVITVALAICGGLIAGLVPSGPEDEPLDLRAAQLGSCFRVMTADFISAISPSDLPDPRGAVPDPKPGSRLRVVSNINGYAKVVEIDRSGRRLLAAYDLVGQGSRWIVQTSQVAVPCRRLVMRPECKAWPGVMWAEANRRADRVRTKTGRIERISRSDSPESPHYWSGKILDAGGFHDEQGAWHPIPTNCYPGG